MKLHYEDPTEYLVKHDYEGKINQLIRIILAAAVYTLLFAR